MGTQAIQLQQMALEDLSVGNPNMSNPSYMSDMTLADWKLFSKAESLHEFRKSQNNNEKY